MLHVFDSSFLIIVSSFLFQVSCFKFLVSSFLFLVPTVLLLVSSFKFQVSCFKVLVSCFAFVVPFSHTDTPQTTDSRIKVVFYHFCCLRRPTDASTLPLPRVIPLNQPGTAWLIFVAFMLHKTTQLIRKLQTIQSYWNEPSSMATRFR